MKAIVTAYDEPTLELCIWSLKRNGFDVEVMLDKRPLWDKLREILHNNKTESFLRVDADIIVNKNMKPELLSNLFRINREVWWWQFKTFDWYKQDIAHSLSYIRWPAIKALRANIDKFDNSLRPETELSRIKELHDPRRMITYEDMIVGLHGYGIKNIDRVKELKDSRKQYQLYDFELAEKLNQL